MRSLFTSVLLLLLLGSQATAGACATRCAVSDMGGTQRNASAVATSHRHFHGATDNSEGATVRTPTVCNDELCQNDFAFLDRTNAEPGSFDSLALMPVVLKGVSGQPFPIRISRIIPIRSTGLPAAFDLLNSKLRI